MSGQQESAVDTVAKALAPAAAKGDPWAQAFLARLLVADDPEAEAWAICNEVWKTVKRLCDVLGPTAEAYTAWTRDGIEAAEHHANRLN